MKKQNTHKGSWSRLFSVLKPQWLSLILVLIFSLVSSYALLQGTKLTGLAIDAMVPFSPVDSPYMVSLVVQMIAYFVCGAFFLWLLTRLALLIATKAATSLRLQAFEQLMHLPLRFFDRHPHGDIINKLTYDIENVTEGLQQMLGKLFSGVALLFGSLWFMFTINKMVALMVLIITPLSVWLSAFIARRSSAAFFAQSQTVGQLNGLIEESLSMQRVIQDYSAQNIVGDQFDTLNEQLYVEGQRAQFASSMPNPFSRLINHIVYVAIGCIGGYLCLFKNTLTVGELSSLLMYASQFAKPINEITGVWSQFQQALSCLRSVSDLLYYEREFDDSIYPLLPESASYDVNFSDVSFGYDEHKPPIIDALNLFVPYGKKIAIVGPTGSGKTTLVNLLMRFYDLRSGQISLNDVDIASVQRNSVRLQFGMVLQDFWVFRGTVFQNIAYGKQDATEEEVIAAAKAAFAHRFICKLAKGYDTILDENCALSAGQKQLLTIARVFLCDPKILILDEATSAIDTTTESHITMAMEALMANKTSFVIAHRLSTIQNADLILVLKDGRIIETGTHKELLAGETFYHQLYQAQFAGVVNENVDLS